MVENESLVNLLDNYSKIRGELWEYLFDSTGSNLGKVYDYRDKDDWLPNVWTITAPKEVNVKRSFKFDSDYYIDPKYTDEEVEKLWPAVDMVLIHDVVYADGSENEYIKVNRCPRLYYSVMYEDIGENIYTEWKEIRSLPVHTVLRFDEFTVIFAGNIMSERKKETGQILWENLNIFLFKNKEEVDDLKALKERIGYDE